MRKLTWMRVAGNTKWLRGYIPRNPHPTSFTQAMMPERNARYDDLKPYIDWCHERNIPVEFVTAGMLAFEDERFITMFLLRWM